MQPRDFFDHVNLALHIEPPARNVHAEPRFVLALGNQGKAKPLQHAEDEPCVETRTQNAAHFADMQHDWGRIHRLRDHVDHIANQFAAARLQNHLRHQIARQYRRFEIGAALKAV
jgi:hypothetical protein